MKDQNKPASLQITAYRAGSGFLAAIFTDTGSCLMSWRLHTLVGVNAAYTAWGTDPNDIEQAFKTSMVADGQQVKKSQAPQSSD